MRGTPKLRTFLPAPLARRMASHEGGFSLIAVLWITALFALISVAFMRDIQSHLRETSSVVEGERAEALADAGVNLAVMDIMAFRKNARSDRRFPVSNSPVACTVSGDESITVRVQDAGGKVNLNAASTRLLQALFLGLGSDLDTASLYADRIIDFRDQDDNERPAGAEREAYLAAGRGRGPKNAPFDAVEELYQVLGLDAAAIAAAQEHVTLHSGMAGIDPSAVSKDLADLLIRGEEGLPGATLQRDPTDALPAEFSMPSPRRTFVIHSEARLASGAVYVREAVIDFSTTQTAYHVFKAWKRGRVTAGNGGEDASALPPC
jgi:general secretion pathway protein K